MTFSAEQLERLRDAQREAADHSRSRSECPSADRFWMAVGGELSPSDVRAVVQHTIECSECAEAWRLARETRALSGLMPAPASEQPSRHATWVALSAAAAVAVAAGLAVAIRTNRGPGQSQPPVFREMPGAELRSLVSESEPLPRSRFVLQWTRGPNGPPYRVHVATSDLKPIADAFDLETESFVVPADALARVPSGANIIWQVEALGQNGERITSRTFTAKPE